MSTGTIVLFVLVTFMALNTYMHIRFMRNIQKWQVAQDVGILKIIAFIKRTHGVDVSPTRREMSNPDYHKIGFDA